MSELILPLREALFPDCPPFLNFIPGKQTYSQDSKIDFVVWTVASGSSPTVTDCIAKLGCKITEWNTRDFSGLAGPVWDHLLVSEKSNAVDFSHLDPTVKINKFPASSVLCRKDQLWTSYAKLRSEFGKKEFNFFPETYNLPEDANLLKKAMKKRQGIWIVKPPGASCGYGIKIVTSFKEIPERNYILSVQKYIKKPLLINKLKFDLRLYVLLTDIDPLKIYLYHNGLVRFSTKPYSISKADLNDKYIHLTNYSVNKNNGFLYNENHEEFSGHKWALETLWKYLAATGQDTKEVWARIEELTVKSILSCHSHMIKTYREQVKYENCFYKLFGMDVMLDDTLKPWLIEFNNFPSLENPSLDRHVNDPMIAELFNIVGFNISSKLSSKQKASIKKEYGLKGSQSSILKENYPKEKYKTEMERTAKLKDALHKNLETGEGLIGSDVRMLATAQEEISQAKGFTRIFPCEDSHLYWKYIHSPSHNDQLLQYWETKYSHRRGDGIALISKLTEMGKHKQ